MSVGKHIMSMTILALSLVVTLWIDSFTKHQIRELPWPNDMGKRVLKISKRASKGISLFGAYNNGVYEENFKVERVNGQSRIQAWWMLDSIFEVYRLDLEIDEVEFQAIWQVVEESQSFQLESHHGGVSHDMTYWLTIANDGQTHKTCIYGLSAPGMEVPSQFKNWNRLVNTLLAIRTKFSALAYKEKFDPVECIREPLVP